MWAFASTPYVSYHSNNRGAVSITLPSSGGCALGAAVVVKYPSATLHGVLMWFAWSVLGVAQVYTNRYMKHFWRFRQAIHTTLGVLSGCVTLAGTIIVLSWLDWAFYFDHWHNVAGILFMVLCQILVLGGVYTLVMRRYVNFDWQTKKMFSLTSIHKYFAYFMIFAVQVTITTGIIRRVSIGQHDKGKWIVLVIANLVLYLGALGYGEYMHQKRLSTVVPLKGKDQIIENMSRQNF